MSDQLAHYSFIPWLRQGIATKIAEKDALGAAASGMAVERADLQVGLTLESTDIADGSVDATDFTKTLKMLGPPDVLAVSQNAIVRAEPKSKVNNYEANGLPYIEFYKEDFLWIYTPAAADSVANEGKLTPWLALICLKDDEFELKNTIEGRAFITIDSGKIVDVFHDPTQHWAWGHVHMNTELIATNITDQITEVSGELEEDPDSGVCRLLCPRKLIKETHYTAFLVPAFETGRLAGLGADYTGILAQQMSFGGNETDYTSKSRGTEYPVYHMWSFQTGKFGDFESLARILEPVVTDPELGKRDMFVAEAGYGLEDASPDSTVLGLEGALKPPDFVSDKWTNGNGDKNYQDHLRKLLNLSIDNEKKQTDDADVASDSLVQNPFYSASLGDDPIVTPHIYGRWHAMVKRLKKDNNFRWVNSLNLDPRNRAAAALGVAVVKNNQEDYMQRAWKQVEELNEANDKIRKAGMSRLISHALYSKHLKYANNDQTVRLTSPMHSFVLSAETTAENEITNSLIPNASKSGAFKKVIRPGKKSNKKINSFANSGANLIHTAVIDNFNSENIKTANDKTAPTLTVDIATITGALQTSVTNFQGNETAMAQQALFDTLLEETAFDDLETTSKKNALKAKVDVYEGLTANSKNLAKDVIDGISSSTQGEPNESHNIIVEAAPYKAVFGEEVTAKTYENIIVSRDTGGEAGLMGRATLLQDIEAFGTAFLGFGSDVVAQMFEIPKADPLPNLSGFSTNITKAIQPKELVMKRVINSITLNVFDNVLGIYKKEEIKTLKPIMAYPKFDDAMFDNLKDLSQEYILPNIDKVPENSITLLETNQAFIEAFMAGLNHEMSAELLWREFPTDQRGTYFRQFWDVSDNVMETDQEKKYDITKMHTWKKNLGKHSPRIITNPSGSTYLVLLIRGELLKKYPNTQVYANKAAYSDVSSPDTPRELSDPSIEENIQLPVFMAELDPDIYLFGFDLDVDEAKGDSSDASKPGWFFVLRERPGQIRFGLDDWTPVNPSDPDFPTSDPTDWNDLSWEHLVSDRIELENYQIDAQHAFDGNAGSANTPSATWGKNSADLAYILYQNPVLFARHGQEMLPD